MESIKINKLNIEKIRKDFPVLTRKVNGKNLVYLDNAASTQKPMMVIDSVRDFYLNYYANIHRGVYQLSEESTLAYEKARENVKKFLNARSLKEIVFTSGTTDSINLVSHSFGKLKIKEGDEIIISHMEHHANIVPWQVLCEEKKAKLKVIPINDSGELLLDEYHKLITGRTKLVAINHISNTLGTINPVKEIIDYAHSKNVPVLIDGAQAMLHVKIDVRKLDCDFYVFSGHKMFGPTGIGILYGKEEILEKMPPFKTGGDMIKTVSFEKTTYNDLPHKFEAGTPNIAGAIGLSAAIDYIKSFDFNELKKHECELLKYATEKLLTIQSLRIIGTAEKKGPVISFVLDNVHPHDVGTILDTQGVAIRTGHHCTMPLMKRFGVPATARASMSIYNTKEEIDILVSGIYKAIKLIG